MSNLLNLKIKSMQLYFQYKNNSITLDDYLEQIKLLDDKIDILEIKTLRCYLKGTPVFEKSFSSLLD